ncbi:MAG: hypothetical protein JNM28_06185 [Armatimonadetes bacterium]|nr:hypothetical protein [Armatimonadota bacterium]
MSKTRILRIAPLLCIVALMAGCGGNGSDTPPAGGGTSDYTAEIALGGTESATLTVSVSGNTATGTLVKDSTRGFPPVPDGTTQLSGTFTAPSTFHLTGSLTGGVPIELDGTLPGDQTAGSYQLKSGSDTLTGGFLPKKFPKPAIAWDRQTLSFEPGQGGGNSLIKTNFPTGGTISYRYFIAAPAAYVRNSATPPVTGQDIEISDDQVYVQTSAADSGKLKTYCQAYFTKDGVRTFLAQAYFTVDLVDVQFVPATWFEEIGTNPQGNIDYHSYGWDIPLVADAKEYVVSHLNYLNGSELLRYRIHAGDIDATANTTTPIFFGAFPHSFPPVIPVSEELSGSAHTQFFRRGNSMRMLIVVTDPGLEGPYRDHNPISVKVYK